MLNARMIRVTVLLIALLATVMPALCASSRDEVTLPAYVRIVSEESSADEFIIPDSLFYEISGKTIFKVNKTILNEADPFVIELAEKILPLANAKGWQLEAIELRGAASPEGPYKNNVRLSIGRAKALRDFMTSRLDNVNLGDVTTTNTIAEDYPYLLWLLERDGDSAAPLLRKIMEQRGDNPASIKSDLQKLHGGRVWRRLLRDYFPRCRAAKVVLFFSRLYPEVPRIEVIDLPPAELPVKVEAPQCDIQPAYWMPQIGIRERKHMLSLGTNLLYDAFYMPNFGWAPMPNLQLEYYPSHGNFTFVAEFMWPYYHRWSRHKFFQIRDYHLEARRYHNPGLHHTGFYYGAYVNNSIYGIGFSKTKGWEGEGLGGGLKIGYAFNPGNSRWRIDMFAAAGVYYTWFDPYVYGNPISGVEDGDYYYDYKGPSHNFRKRNHRLAWFGPTEIGITITYDVLYRRTIPRGISARRYELGIR